MSKLYKVWAEIEVEDLETGDNENLSHEVVKIGTFHSLTDAQAFVAGLENLHVEGGSK